MLRIDHSTTPQQDPVVYLAGDFTDQYIPCVVSAIAQARPHGGRILLNLRHVCLVDRGAMCYLNGLRDADVALVECPAYVLRWMEQESSNCG